MDGIYMSKETGHPRFYELSQAECDLHAAKNHDYARGGDPMGNFNRVSTILGLYPDFQWQSPAGFAWLLMWKQIDAVMWAMSKGDAQRVESVQDKLMDISVYSKLIMILLEESNLASIIKAGTRIYLKPLECRCQCPKTENSGRKKKKRS
jgi:hypothetical protein